VPSAFNPSKFKCYTDAEKVLVVSGMLVTVVSSLFSGYKLRIAVRKRLQRLRAANIEPTFKRVVFIEHTLANLSKIEMFPLAGEAASLGEPVPESVAAIVDMVHKLQRQLAHVVEQQRQQQHEQILQQQQYQQQLLLHQQEIQELKQRLMRLEQ
jgi:hypothetical protein